MKGTGSDARQQNMARKSKADIAAEEAERAEYMAGLVPKHIDYTVNMTRDELVDLRDYAQYLLEQDSIKQAAQTRADLNRLTEECARNREEAIFIDSLLEKLNIKR